MRLIDLTREQLERLAAAVGTSYDTMRHYARGRRGVSAAKAIVIEKAAKRMRLDVQREDLCAACSGCELARKARKG